VGFVSTLRVKYFVYAWLELTHKRLDEAVFADYGYLSDEEILEKLLALNLERAHS
jgi:hypothetical protein